MQAARGARARHGRRRAERRPAMVRRPAAWPGDQAAQARSGQPRRGPWASRSAAPGADLAGRTGPPTGRSRPDLPLSPRPRHGGDTSFNICSPTRGWRMSFNLATILSETALATPDARSTSRAGPRPPTASLTSNPVGSRRACSSPALSPATGGHPAAERAALPDRLLRRAQGRDGRAAGQSAAEGRPRSNTSSATPGRAHGRARGLHAEASKACDGRHPVVPRQHGRRRAADGALRVSPLLGRSRRGRRPRSPERHRGADLHQRHDGEAQGRRAHPLPAVHELHHRRPAVRGPQR